MAWNKAKKRNPVYLHQTDPLYLILQKRVLADLQVSVERANPDIGESSDGNDNLKAIMTRTTKTQGQ